MTKACGVSLVRAPIRSGNQGGTAGVKLVPWGRAFVFYGGRDVVIGNDVGAGPCACPITGDHEGLPYVIAILNV